MSEKVSLIGARVLLLPDHPWAGEVGTVLRAEQTMVGVMLVVQLDNGQSAGVFSQNHIKVLELADESD